MVTIRSLSHPSHISLSVRDTDGNDLSSAPNITIFHRTVSPSNPLTKRGTYIINQCDAGYEFSGSVCVRSSGPQKYWITCHRIGGDLGMTGRWGDCTKDQICIQPRVPPGNPPQAYCVDTQSYVEVARSRQTGPAPQINNQVLDVPGANDYAVSAVLTGMGGTTSVFAQQLAVQAQSYTMMGNVPAWGTLPGGVDSCHDCASVSLHPLPIGTKRVSVSVLLAAGTTIAKLYIETVMSLKI